MTLRYTQCLGGEQGDECVQAGIDSRFRKAARFAAGDHFSGSGASGERWS